MTEREPHRAPGEIARNQRMNYLRGYARPGQPKPKIDMGKRRERFFLYKRGLPPVEETECYVCRSLSREWHHIVPMCRWGKDSLKNLVPLCGPCHRKVHRHPHRTKGYKRPFQPVLVKPKFDVMYVPPARVVSDLAKQQYTKGREV